MSVNPPTQPGHESAGDHGHDHPHPHPHEEPAAADDHGHDQGEHGHGHPHEVAADDHGHDHGEHDHDHGDHGHDHGDHGHRGGVIGFFQSLFMPHSHDSADSIDSAIESSAKGIRAVKISLVALMVTALLQVLLVLVTGSVALLADTIHNFSDALTSVPLWIAFILGRRAANRRYTYGYRRAEDLAGLFIVGMIAFSAILAGWESVNRLLDPKPITNLWLVAAAGIIGFIGNELVALYRIRVGKEIGSAALVADGLHARTDGFTSLAVLFGAIGVALGFPQADPLVGLLITVAILFVLKDAMRSVFGRLMDAVDPTVVDSIERVASAVSGVQNIDGVRVRWIGHRLEASLHAEVDCQMTVAAGHDIAEEVRHALFHDLKNLDSVLVHIDPCEHPETDHHGVTRGHEPKHLSRSSPRAATAAAASPPVLHA